MAEDSVPYLRERHRPTRLTVSTPGVRFTVDQLVRLMDSMQREDIVHRRSKIRLELRNGMRSSLWSPEGLRRHRAPGKIRHLYRRAVYSDGSSLTLAISPDHFTLRAKLGRTRAQSAAAEAYVTTKFVLTGIQPAPNLTRTLGFSLASVAIAVLAFLACRILAGAVFPEAWGESPWTVLGSLALAFAAGATARHFLPHLDTPWLRSDPDTDMGTGPIPDVEDPSLELDEETTA